MLGHRVSALSIDRLFIGLPVDCNNSMHFYSKYMYVLDETFVSASWIICIFIPLYEINIENELMWKTFMMKVINILEVRVSYQIIYYSNWQYLILVFKLFSVWKFSWIDLQWFCVTKNIQNNYIYKIFSMKAN